MTFQTIALPPIPPYAAISRKACPFFKPLPNPFHSGERLSSASSRKEVYTSPLPCKRLFTLIFSAEQVRLKPFSHCTSQRPYKLKLFIKTGKGFKQKSLRALNQQANIQGNSMKDLFCISVHCF